uniref:Uncharacterized protein n=1 Tax=Rhizophagus irregularis (strain DAOM 181602 / DAOM 197198 / MUCL 43194) TaxID=747089 RepID=U9UBX7_RHIID
MSSACISESFGKSKNTSGSDLYIDGIYSLSSSMVGPDYWNENYDYVEESDLHEPRMTENRDGQILTNDEWAKI